MVSNDENIYLMNNGEIYNYLEIKKYLNEIKFKSEGDTEVFRNVEKIWNRLFK